MNDQTDNTYNIAYIQSHSANLASIKIGRTYSYPGKNLARFMKDPVKLGRVNSSGNLFWVDIISIRARVISSFQNTAPRISEKHRKCRIAWFLRCLKKSLWSMSSYLHSLIGAGKWEAQLLCTKSKVASFKSVSLPQLELCGVLLLSQLMSKIKTAL